MDIHNKHRFQSLFIILGTKIVVDNTMHMLKVSSYNEETLNFKATQKLIVLTAKLSCILNTFHNEI